MLDADQGTPGVGYASTSETLAASDGSVEPALQGRQVGARFDARVVVLAGLLLVAALGLVRRRRAQR
ncbi:MAG TPA: hypothetical protein VF516_01365 [Kofleriaceae bacterium]